VIHFFKNNFDLVFSALSKSSRTSHRTVVAETRLQLECFGRRILLVQVICFDRLCCLTSPATLALMSLSFARYSWRVSALLSVRCWYEWVLYSTARSLFHIGCWNMQPRDQCLQQRHLFEEACELHLCCFLLSWALTYSCCAQSSIFCFFVITTKAISLVT
jgi:hypothetical protein